MKLIAAGLSGLILTVAAAPMASAADAPAPPGATAAVVLSVDTKIGELLANPVTKAIVDKYMPGLETSPYLDMAKAMTVRDASKYPQAGLDDAKLAAMDTELKAAK
ncbi:MAG TPA: hypothetical protein VF459_11675 [Caulobacteraceae bacterium]